MLVVVETGFSTCLGNAFGHFCQLFKNTILISNDSDDN